MNLKEFQQINSFEIRSADISEMLEFVVDITNEDYFTDYLDGWVECFGVYKNGILLNLN